MRSVQPPVTRALRDALLKPLSMVMPTGGTYSTSSSDNHTVTVVDIDSTASLLREKRKALLDQLHVVDRALAALAAATSLATNALGLPTTAVPTEEAANPVLPTRVRPPRVLSDSHRQALTEGRRKGRHAKDAAAGHARETLDPAPGLTRASRAPGLPRLVKRQTPRARR